MAASNSNDNIHTVNLTYQLLTSILTNLKIFTLFITGMLNISVLPITIVTLGDNSTCKQVFVPTYAFILSFASSIKL